MAKGDLVAGDGASKLRVTIRDSATQQPVDLTGKTVTLRFVLNSGTVEQRSMTVLNQAASKGQAEYQFTTSDIPAAGELKGEFRLQSGQPDQLTTDDTFHLQVKAPLA